MAKIRIFDKRTRNYFRVDDEYLNGYAKLCGINATGVYLSLCRHADLEQKCFPSKKVVGQELAISERSVYSAIKTLEKWGIIRTINKGRKKDGSFHNNVYILLDKSEWEAKPSATGAVGRKQQPPSANNDINRRQLVPNKETHINNTHIRKGKHSFSGADINLLIELFKPVNPLYKDLFENLTERKALKDVVAVNGIEKTEKLLRELPKLTKIKGCPQICRPYDLKKKLGNLNQFRKQQRQKNEKKPYFMGNVMSKDLCFVLVGGEWKKFAGLKNQIEWK